ncbi:Uncharacterized protein dnm_017580 [Desulfonema magnum]|uniref:Uncharacterized protein n=1 Tax=Desulfonema magnum TaxID=45655 RepID=A0A975BHB9_9BACT|nr:Uncharacterized protein dnm_017580 [Desulfonema magnum]
MGLQPRSAKGKKRTSDLRDFQNLEGLLENYLARFAVNIERSPI